MFRGGSALLRVRGVPRRNCANALDFTVFPLRSLKAVQRLSCISSRALAACTHAVHSRSVSSSGHCRGKSSRPFQVW